MAGAFASGFQMGGNIYNQAERNRLEQAQEERRAIEFAQAQEDRARAVGLREQEDALRNQLTRPNMENYALAAPSQSVGLRMGAQPAAQLPEEGLAMPQMAAPAGGIGMREGASLGGLRAPAADTRQPTFNAAPTGAAAEDILGRMALIKGDTGAFRASQVAARGYKYEDAYKTATEKWNGMSDDEKGELITKASYDTGIKGFGTWVPGKGKQAGYMNYMAPGQDPIKLSANEAKELYALTTAMEHDPMRARGEMEKVSDKVRLLASQAFEAQTKGVQASNMATHYGNVDAATAAHYASQGALTNARLEELKAQQKAREDVAVLGNQYANLSDSEKNSSKGRGLLQQMNIANVKAGGQINLGPMDKTAKVFDPKEYAATIKSFTDAGVPLPEATMKADQMYGRMPPTDSVDLGLQKFNAKKGAGTAAAPIEVRPGESRMTAPGVIMRSPLSDFLRESRRNLLGGVEYFYTDPLTKKRYTTEQYNQMQSQ